MALEAPTTLGMELSALTAGTDLKVNAVATGTELFGRVVSVRGAVFDLAIDRHPDLQRPGEPVGCSYAVERGVAFFAAEVGEWGDEEPAALTLCLVTAPVVRERRQHVRVDTSGELRWSPLTTSGTTSGEFVGRIMDLSLGGARFVTDAVAPAAGAMILASFDREDDSLVIIAQVVGTVALDQAPSSFEVRVSFVAVEDGTGRKISEVLGARAASAT